MYRPLRDIEHFVSTHFRYPEIRDYLASLVNLMKQDRPDSIDGTPIFAETNGPLPSWIADQLEAYRRATPRDGKNIFSGKRRDDLMIGVPNYGRPFNASSHSSGRR
ncbi:hypothetical protein J4453_02865 [Candidatus Woesearchaeota archaeon]|nr:hypothetical protein [Candidatus Woesearchaeota archaeon]